MTFINEENRQKFIDEVQKLGRFYESLAESYALKAIRNPKNKDAQETAQEYVLKHDSRQDMVNKIIDFVNAYWPRAESLEEKKGK